MIQGIATKYNNCIQMIQGIATKYNNCIQMIQGIVSKWDLNHNLALKIEESKNNLNEQQNSVATVLER